MLQKWHSSFLGYYKMKHVNIPIFIPHLGCPNQCVFCNQTSISGVAEFDPEKLKSIIDNALFTIPDDYIIEIAFFGGSFTGIDRLQMIDLLKTAYSYIEKGRVSHIRCSTRPDYIDLEVLDILKKYGVKVIELGLQSSSDFVLTATKRGHNFESEKTACRMIVEHGFDLVGQMMIGLPDSTLDDEKNTAQFIIDCGAKYARIYPTVVFKDTELLSLTESGCYLPLSLEDAVDRSAEVLKMFFSAGIDVIRIGLCASENLSSKDTYFAGPNHPAIGELVENKIYLENIKKELDGISLFSDDIVRVGVACGCLSKAIGQNKKNKFLLMQNFNIRDVKFFESSNISKYEVSIVVERKNKNVLKIT